MSPPAENKAMSIGSLRASSIVHIGQFVPLGVHIVQQISDATGIRRLSDTFLSARPRAWFYQPYPSLQLQYSFFSTDINYLI